MPTSFDQQNPATNFSMLKSAQPQQHGQKADPKTAKFKEKRSFEPRQAH